jgi:hypothetical protein
MPAYPGDEPGRIAAVAKAISANAADNALITALLTLLSRDTGVECSRLLEYSPYFMRHDPAATITAYLKARRSVKSK